MVTDVQPRPYDRVRCGLCGCNLTGANCHWRTFPGLCVGCAPPSLYIRQHGYRSTGDDGHRRHPRDAGPGQGTRAGNYARVGVGGTTPGRIVTWHKPPEDE